MTYRTVSRAGRGLSHASFSYPPVELGRSLAQSLSPSLIQFLVNTIRSILHLDPKPIAHKTLWPQHKSVPLLEPPLQRFLPITQHMIPLTQRLAALSPTLRFATHSASTSHLLMLISCFCRSPITPELSKVTHRLQRYPMMTPKWMLNYAQP